MSIRAACQRRWPKEEFTLAQALEAVIEDGLDYDRQCVRGVMAYHVNANHLRRVAAGRFTFDLARENMTHGCGRIKTRTPAERKAMKEYGARLRAARKAKKTSVRLILALLPPEARITRAQIVAFEQGLRLPNPKKMAALEKVYFGREAREQE